MCVYPHIIIEVEIDFCLISTFIFIKNKEVIIIKSISNKIIKLVTKYRIKSEFIDLRYKPIINYCIIISYIMVINLILFIISSIYFENTIFYSIMKYIGILNLIFVLNMLLIINCINIQYKKSMKNLDTLFNFIDLICDNEKEVNLNEIKSKFSKED